MALLGLWLGAAIAGPFAMAQEAPATGQEGLFPGAAALGEAVAQMATRRWIGPRVDPPDEHERPSANEHYDAGELRLHGPTLDGYERDAAEEAAAFARYLSAGGFELPFSDGGRGGSEALDLYLAPLPNMRAAYSDGDVPLSFHDRVSAFAVVDPVTAGDRLALCAIEAVARATMLSLVPDEAESWRNAYASWLTWRYTGQFGCSDAEREQQEEPSRGWIAGAADEGAGGGLYLAMLSDRHSRGTGAFLRSLLESARQRTWEGNGYRGSPDLWQVLERSLRISGEKLIDAVQNMAVDRFFGASVTEMTPPIFAETRITELPFHSRNEPILEPFGSVYLWADVRDAPPESRLRVWLRGEYGVEWGLTAVRLDERLNRMTELSAPPRAGDPRAYVPLELDERVAYVLVVGTNLSHRLPDADDEVDPNARSLRFIMDVAREGE